MTTKTIDPKASAPKTLSYKTVSYITMLHKKIPHGTFCLAASVKQLTSTLLLISLALLITACGGGSSGADTNPATDGPNPNNGGSISGSVVKGPLIGATVSAYAFAPTAPNLFAAPPITESITNTSAAIDTLIIPANSSTPIIIEVDGTNATDISSNITPVIQTLRSAVTASMLSNGDAIYVTPLTTIALEIARQNADTAVGPFTGNENTQISSDELAAALPIAGQITVAAFGFGMNINSNLFTTAPIVNDSTTDASSLANSAQYRAAIESISALLLILQTDIGNSTANIPDTDTLLMALARDLADGEVDGNNFGNAIAELVDVSDINSVLSTDLSLVTVPNTNTNISDIESLMISETSTTGFSNIDTSPLNNGGDADITPTDIDLNPDTDNDGTNDREDSDSNNSCIPTAFVQACEQDSDGDGSSDFNEGETTDSDGDGIANYLESSLTDTDLDGVTDQNDPQNADACVPNIFVASCTQDTDGDGVSDFNEGETNDTDADGIVDYLESSVTDADLDGVTDQNDPQNNNACVPNIFVASCMQDTDGDGVSDFNEGETNDSDADGIANYLESSITDADFDGVSDQNDPQNTNACVPNVFVASCGQDTDGDGVSDFNEGENTDSDSDGLLDYQESSILDDDNDGTPNQSDPENANPCVPNAAQNQCLPGISNRPANSSCVAPEISVVDNTITLSRRLPNVSFSRPVKALQAPGDSSFWYVVEQPGRIKRVVNSESATEAPIYFSIPVLFDGESGLLGMAFSPDWPSKKELYVYYVTDSPALQSRVSRITITDDTTLPVTATEQVILTISQFRTNHNGGEIAFGADGYLYISTGDGGGSNDTENNSQTTSNLLGNMLRIDVNDIAYPTPGYSIPINNPFNENAKCGPSSNAQSCPEIYAWGLRNPWRWSFDPQTNDLWVGDVGQENWEEINKLSLAGNFGWRCKEGTHDFNLLGCNINELIDPVYEYSHENGNNAITGGFVYRGTNMPSLVGNYLFADSGSGRIWSLSGNTSSGFQADELIDSSHAIAAFAQDHNNELYVLSYLSGGLYQIELDTSTGGDTIPTLLSDTGCVSDTNPSLPASGLIPYQPNARFWSDNAAKQRWIALPDNTSIDPSDNNIWDYPNGTVTMKNFVVENRLIETRLFMRHPNGQWAGYSYEWDEAVTNATRVVGGKLRTLSHTAAPQQWIYPSEGECLQCHTSAAGYVLGLSTPQLNGEFDYPDSGITDNQLETFNHINLFTQDVSEPVSALPSISDPENNAEPLLFRAKAYLQTNCASCHRPNGGTQANMDLRFETPLAQMGICNIDPLLSSLGIVDAKIIAPGMPEKSVLLNRMNRRDNNAMPPIGSNLIDTSGVQLIEQWINELVLCN